MTASTKLALGLTLALLAIGSLYGAEQRARGRAEARAADALALADSLRARGATIESVYVRDTIRLRTVLTRYDSVRTTDTLTRNDTVFVPREVADQAVQACRAALTTCEIGWANAKAENTALRRALDAQPKPPSAFAVWGGRLLWLGAGFGLGKLAP